MSQDTTSRRAPCDTGPRYLSPLNLTSPDLSLRVLGHAGLQGTPGRYDPHEEGS